MQQASIRHPLAILIFVAWIGCVAAQDGAVGSALPVSRSVAISTGVQVETVAERRVVSEATDPPQVSFITADQLSVGDEIFYTLRIRNTTDSPINGVTVTKPVPRNTRYVADSAIGPGVSITVSVDGGSTFVDPYALDSNASVGAPRRPLPDEFTHIRWQLRHPLAPGATALLRFRGVFK
jgi:uncharacterized repeat protein (TIGR01451 family)